MNTVILTFDDGTKSQFEYARPILKNLGLPAVFFPHIGNRLKPFPIFPIENITTLHEDGFEIGNHTLHHFNLTALKGKIDNEFIDVQVRLKKLGINSPISVAYPGFHYNSSVLEAARRHCEFGRVGCDIEPFGAWQEGGEGRGFNLKDCNKLALPCLGVFGKNYGYENMVSSLEKLNVGEIGILCFHEIHREKPILIKGKPFGLSTSLKEFEKCMNYLKENNKIKTFRDIK